MIIVGVGIGVGVRVGVGVGVGIGITVTCFTNAELLFHNERKLKCERADD